MPSVFFDKINICLFQKRVLSISIRTWVVYLTEVGGELLSLIRFSLALV